MEFQFKVVYRRGKLHQDVDCLSRAPIPDDDYLEDKVLSIVRPLNPLEWGQYNDDESKELLRAAEAGKDNMVVRNAILYR